ncbi:MAG: hypothetical protein ABIZ49_07695 [Opitutaceae bacterium]
MKTRFFGFVLASFFAVRLAQGAAAQPTLAVTTPMPAPEWAKLERRLLAETVPATRAFVQKYYDDRGYIQCFVRWGANDGADDAFENFRQWPELHALGASDEVIQLYLKTWEGMIRQYTEAKTVDVEVGRQGMYYKDFSAQSDWMHHGEGMQNFVRMGLSVPNLPAFQKRARVYAGLYMDEDPEAKNYDPKLKLIRSMQNGSRGPMLRKATALDWVGDPFDVKGFDALHGEDTYEQFLAHYVEYSDVVGDHFLNLVATTLPATAYLVTGEAKYKKWIVEYMDAWLERMKQNKGIIPSYVALDGKVGGPEGKWWNNAYGWGFSPVNPVNGRRENRHRIPRAVAGFNSALLVTGDQKYIDAWRTMIDAVNANARTVDGRTQYPSMYGAEGWYGWQGQPWSVGALEVWYGSMKPSDLARAPQTGWLSYLQGKDAAFPETALQRDLNTVAQRAKAIAEDKTPPAKRLADNMLNKNPATVGAMLQLMMGAIPPGNDGSMLHARLRYFDPQRRRAGVPEDVGALISELTDTSTVVTLVNVNAREPRTVVVQGGAYGEHQIETVEVDGRTTRVGGRDFTVQLAAGAGAKFTLAMKRYANAPTLKFPWER